MQSRKTRVLIACLLLGLAPLILAKDKKPKKIKATENPPQYAAFANPLPQEEQFHHALDRLTFGSRPGDLEALRQIGLKSWLAWQLHPESVPENPLLEQRLEPLTSLRMNIHDTYLHYPPPQMIAAVARGRAPLPDDPELRAIVVRLADRYLEKKNANAQFVPVSMPPRQLPGLPGTLNLNTPDGMQKTLDAAKAQQIPDPNDDADLDLKVKLRDILTPEQIDTLRNGKPDAKRALLENLPVEERTDFVWALRRQQRQQLFSLAPVELRRELMLAVNPQNVVTSDLTEGKLVRAIYSTHQLQELLVDFWFNHFNVFINKGSDRFTVPTYEREAIRPHVFGKFYDLLLETAMSPAMMFYLDNWESEGSNPPDRLQSFGAKPKPRRGLNENYGRELMELHTLGVDGGYTQQDVINVARCFTGWTIAKPAKGGGFEYNDKMHDKNPKFVLGHVIRGGGGMSDGLTVLAILASHPSTAHFISLQLAKRFVADDPPPSLVNRMAETFLNTDGDLRAVTAVMIESPEFWSEGAYRAKFKTPFEMIVSAVRATNADVTSAYSLAGELNKLGEPLYQKIEPTGYSNGNAEWVSSAGLLDRMNFSLALALNRVAGIKVDADQWQTITASDPLALARQILEQNPSQQTQAAIEKTLNDPELQKQLAKNAKAGPPQIPSLVAGLTIGSPEFQRR